VTLQGRTPAWAAPFGYVVNHGDGTVSVLDTASNLVVATVTVGSEPLGAAVNPAGTRAYVTNQVAPAGSVSVIDTSLNGVVATIDVGARPSGVAVKLPGNRAYVTNRDDKNVSVIDTAVDAVIATVTVGNNPLGVAVDPAGTPAYVVNKGSNNVSVIDTTTNEVVSTIDVGNDPSHVAISPNGRRVYVSNTSNASVSVIDTGFNSVIATIPVGNIPEGVAVDPSGTRLYVANSGPNSVSVVDTATNGVIATVDVGLTPFELALRPDGARLFVANRQSGDVSVIDTATNAVTGTVSAGFGPAGFGQFIVPALRTPRFVSAARKCQVAVMRQAAQLAKLHHALESACRLGVIKAEAAGKGTAKAEAACLKALDPGNPASNLVRARVKMRAAIERSCSKMVPAQINAPCARGAASFGATADCLVTQHGAYVSAMVGDEFSLTRPVPLAGEAQVCQTALAKGGRRFADRLLKDLGKCVEKLLIAAATGKGDDKVIAGCLAKLDLANPLSKASLARDAGLLKIAQKCAGRTPTELGSPCNAAAPTVATTASCVLDGHAADVAKLIAAEFNDACVTLTRIGVASTYPAVCSGIL
jgi:YVTN family beta-propeller protein